MVPSPLVKEKMMSSSNSQENSVPKAQDNGFQAIDVNALETFEDEVSNRTHESEPDFDRFKILFELTDKAEVSVFETLHPDVRDNSQDVFEALIKLPEHEVPPVPEPELAQEPHVDIPEAPPEPTAEEIEAARVAEIREAAHAEGLAQGREEGHAKGYEDGFEKGKAQGFEKGEAEGRESGHAQGLAQGETQGIAQGEEKARDAAQAGLDALTDALGQMEHLTNDLVDRQGEQLLELVFQVAEKALQARVETQEEGVRNTILDALKSLVRPQEIQLNVNPEDYDYIEMVKDSFFESVSSLEHISVQSDPLVARGGCRIDTATASVATDPQSKLEEIRRAFLKAD